MSRYPEMVCCDFLTELPGVFLSRGWRKARPGYLVVAHEVGLDTSLRGQYGYSLSFAGVYCLVVVAGYPGLVRLHSESIHVRGTFAPDLYISDVHSIRTEERR